MYCTLKKYINAKLLMLNFLFYDSLWQPYSMLSYAFDLFSNNNIKVNTTGSNLYCVI